MSLTPIELSLLKIIWILVFGQLIVWRGTASLNDWLQRIRTLLARMVRHQSLDYRCIDWADPTILSPSRFNLGVDETSMLSAVHFIRMI